MCVTWTGKLQIQVFKALCSDKCVALLKSLLASLVLSFTECCLCKQYNFDEFLNETCRIKWFRWNIQSLPTDVCITWIGKLEIQVSCSENGGDFGDLLYEVTVCFWQNLVVIETKYTNFKLRFGSVSQWNATEQTISSRMAQILINGGLKDVSDQRRPVTY